MGQQQGTPWTFDSTVDEVGSTSPCLWRVNRDTNTLRPREIPSTQRDSHVQWCVSPTHHSAHAISSKIRLHDKFLTTQWQWPIKFVRWCNVDAYCKFPSHADDLITTRPVMACVVAPVRRQRHRPSSTPLLPVLVPCVVTFSIAHHLSSRISPLLADRTVTLCHSLPRPRPVPITNAQSASVALTHGSAAPDFAGRVGKATSFANWMPACLLDEFGEMCLRFPDQQSSL